MVRTSKQGKIRNTSPRKYRAPSPKTGPKKDVLALGFKEHSNAVQGTAAQSFFVPKIK